MRLHILLSITATAIATAASTRPHHPKLSVIYETDSIGPWFENLAVRPSGTILATRMDAPQLWHIDPRRKTGAPLVEVPGVLSTTGIAEVADDVYVFAAGNFSFEARGFVPGSLSVWKVDLSGLKKRAPVPMLIADFPDAGFLNGIAAWDGTRVLVGDTTGSKVYLLDIVSGEFEVALDVPEVAFVNGINVRDGWIYFVSGELGTFYRVPVDSDARPTGAPELIAADLSLDDFDIADDGTVFAAAVWNNQVVRITEDRAVTVIAGGPDSVELLSCTSAKLGRTASDKGTIYVSTMGNGAFPEPGDVTTEAKIVAIKAKGV